jgi:type I restriction enzyme S subunit
MTVTRVVLADVCRQDRKTVKPGDQSALRYIGLESIEAQTGQFSEGELSKTPDAPLANSFLFGQEHVLYGKLRPYLNKVVVPDFTGKCSTEIIPLRPNERLDRRYLAYFLRSPHVVASISEKTAGARMPRADMNYVLGLQMLLPPLADQHRIVDLLSRAEGIVRLRREAQKKAAELIPAIFMEMFGEPVSYKKYLPIRPISDFVARFDGGKNIQSGGDKNQKLRILKVSAVTSGLYLENESKPAPDCYKPPEGHLVRQGDFLFSRANTVDLVGATAVAWSTNGRTLLPDKVWRFVWAEDVDIRYMHALFQTRPVRRKLSSLASGTSDSMRNISQAKLFNLCLPIADLASQRIFGQHAEAVWAIEQQQKKALEKAHETFEALLGWAFEG